MILTHRNPLKEFLLKRNSGRYFGPDECIDDHVESKYCNNSEVRSLIPSVISVI